MNKIKSAWEIALEKTEKMNIDIKKVREDEKIKTIKRFIGSYLSSETDEKEKLEGELKNYKDGEIKKALYEIINTNLTLSENVDEERLVRISSLINIAFDKKNEINTLYEEIVSLLKNYPKERNSLYEELKKQAEPMLKEKERRMQAQYGEGYRINAENDKDFMNIVKKYLENLESEYKTNFDELKNRLLETIK